MFKLFKKKRNLQKPFLSEEQIKGIVAKKLLNPQTKVLAKSGFYALLGTILVLFIIRQFIF